MPRKASVPIYAIDSRPIPPATTARPGSKRKRRVLAERAERGEALFSAEDGLADPELQGLGPVSGTPRRRRDPLAREARTEET